MGMYTHIHLQQRRSKKERKLKQNNTKKRGARGIEPSTPWSTQRGTTAALGWGYLIRRRGAGLLTIPKEAGSLLLPP